MATHIFGVETKRTPEAVEFFETAASRASGPGLHEYFAKWRIIEISVENGDEVGYGVSVSSAFPDAWKIAAAIAFLPMLWTGLKITWWIAPGAAMFALSFLASSYFRYLTMKIGLERYGHTESVKRINESEVMDRLIHQAWDRQRS